MKFFQKILKVFTLTFVLVFIMVSVGYKFVKEHLFGHIDSAEASHPSSGDNSSPGNAGEGDT